MAQVNPDDFRHYLQSKALAKGNITNLMNAFARIPSMEDKVIENFLAELTRSGKSGSYYNKHIQYIRHYGKWQNWPKERLNKYTQVPDHSRVVPSFSDSQIEEFLALGNPNNRLTVFFYIVAYQGTRLGEIRMLHRRDINLARKEMSVKGKKGWRTIPISDEIFGMIEKYVSKINGYLFPHRYRDEPMSPSGYRKEFIRRLEKMGLIDQGYVPYSFRHSFAERNVEEQNFDVNNLAGQMGNSVERILNTYVKKNKKKMRESLNRDRIRKSIDPVQRLNELFEFLCERGFLSDPKFKIEKNAKEIRISLVD